VFSSGGTSPVHGQTDGSLPLAGAISPATRWSALWPNAIDPLIGWGLHVIGAMIHYFHALLRGRGK